MRLERAAAQGIDLSSRRRTSPSGPASPAPDGGGGPPTPDAPPSPLPIEQESNLRVPTSVDRELSLLARRLEDAADRVCLAGYDLDVALLGPPGRQVCRRCRSCTPGSSASSTHQTPTRRGPSHATTSTSLSGPRRWPCWRPSPCPTTRRRFWVFSLKSQMAGTRPVDDAIGLALWLPGPAAMWGLLGGGGPHPAGFAPVATEENRGRLLGAAASSQAGIFGPVLVDRFLALGDPDARPGRSGARVDRAAGDHGKEGFVLATAELASAEGDSRRAERGYATLTGRRPRELLLSRCFGFSDHGWNGWRAGGSWPRRDRLGAQLRKIEERRWRAS